MSEELKEMRIMVDDEPDVIFTGKLLAVASSEKGGNKTRLRWTELHLYKTQKNLFIANELGVSKKSNEKTKSTMKVCSSESEVIDFFGQGWLAKELYKEANIDNAKILE